MSKFITALAAVAALFTFVSAPAHAENLGVWRNPKDNIRLHITDCGPSMCGWVVYASRKAEADAKKSGYDTLVGQQVLRDFAPTGNGNMKGKVFVPTLKVTLSGTAEFVDARTMRAKGCVLGGLFCKSQVWTRVDGGVQQVRVTKAGE